MKKTPFQAKGYTPDDVFVVTEDQPLGTRLMTGDIVVLFKDTGDDIPVFSVAESADEWLDIRYIQLKSIKKIGTLRDETPAEKMGYNVGDVFVVTQDVAFGAFASEGDLVVLSHDDGTPCPWFVGRYKYDQIDDQFPAFLHRVKKIGTL